MKNNTINNPNRKNKSHIRLVSRHTYRFGPANDFIQGIISIFPLSLIDSDFSAYIDRSYREGMQGDWDRIGDDMWLSISKYASSNF